jgi:hypothetical protein
LQILDQDGSLRVAAREAKNEKAKNEPTTQTACRGYAVAGGIGPLADASGSDRRYFQAVHFKSLREKIHTDAATRMVS